MRNTPILGIYDVADRISNPYVDIALSCVTVQSPAIISIGSSIPMADMIETFPYKCPSLCS